MHSNDCIHNTQEATLGPRWCGVIVPGKVSEWWCVPPFLGCAGVFTVCSRQGRTVPPHSCCDEKHTHTHGLLLQVSLVRVPCDTISLRHIFSINKEFM